jgi:deoxyribonuclease-4
MKIGCHVSIAGGLWNAPENAANLKCETFQIFSRSPHGGPVKDIDKETIKKFNAAMKQYGFTVFVIHAPYFLNLGSSNPRIYHGTLSVLRQELERGSLLGANYLMFHPGSLKDLGKEKGMQQAKEGLKKVLTGYKGGTKLLIEISAGAGEVIGDTFEEVAFLMDGVKKMKGFGGICFDTQHAFGSGYDLRTPEAVKKTFAKFNSVIGLEYLKTLHTNDSKVEFGSHKDRHEHIGHGKIGQKGFQAILAFLAAKKLDLPLILETEHDIVEQDIALMKTLRNKVK